MQTDERQRSNEVTSRRPSDLAIGIWLLAKNIIPLAAWPLLLVSALLMSLDGWVPSFNSWMREHSVIRTFLISGITIAFTVLVIQQLARSSKERRWRPFRDDVLSGLGGAAFWASITLGNARDSWDAESAKPDADLTSALESYISGSEQAWRTFHDEWLASREFVMSFQPGAWMVFKNCDLSLRTQFRALQSRIDENFPEPEDVESRIDSANHASKWWNARDSRQREYEKLRQAGRRREALTRLGHEEYERRQEERKYQEYLRRKAGTSG